MTSLVQAPGVALTTRRLPPWSLWGIAGAAVAVSLVAVYAGGALGGGTVLTLVIAGLLYLIGAGAIATIVEGGRSARNRLATSLIYAALTLALLPLLSVTITLISKG